MARLRIFIIFFIIVLFVFPSLGLASDSGQAYENPSSTIVAGQIHQLLKHLGYPENTWGPIEKELIVLLTKIDFPRLKQEANQVKADPLKLKDFLSKLGALLEQDGYIDRQDPHPLIKLLTTSFANDDISQVIFSSPISFLQKVDSKKALVACTAISQLGSIILELLDIKVRVVFSPAHVFNCIPLDEEQVLFVDFSNQIFEIVDIDQYYYNWGSRTRKLKDEHHISLERFREIDAQLPSEYQTDTLEELLCFLYHYIYISDDYATTPAIYINLGNIYSQQGNYDEAFSYFNKAIALEPDNAEAFRERGITYGNKGNLDQASSDLGKAIELFPDFADAYHDRANVYSTRGDIDNAISDLNQAIIINPDFVEAYHDRGKAYSVKGDTDSAISDYDKAIEIDPYFSDAYQSRAEAYFSKQDYDKSWADVHTVEDFGDEMNPDFIEKLKHASQIRKLFPIFLSVPILIVLFYCFLK